MSPAGALATLEQLGAGAFAWLVDISFWCGLLLLTVQLLDRVLAARCGARSRMILYAAVLLRILLPASWSGPVSVSFAGELRPSAVLSPPVPAVAASQPSRLDDPEPPLARLGWRACVVPLWGGVALLLAVGWWRARRRVRSDLRGLSRRLSSDGQRGPPIFEIDCDERVLRRAQPEERSRYMQTLIAVATWETRLVRTRCGASFGAGGRVVERARELRRGRRAGGPLLGLVMLGLACVLAACAGGGSKAVSGDSVLLLQLREVPPGLRLTVESPMDDPTVARPSAASPSGARFMRRVAVERLLRDDRVETIQAPMLLTLESQPASIFIGEETDLGDTLSGCTLDVTPRPVAGNDTLLDVRYAAYDDGEVVRALPPTTVPMSEDRVVVLRAKRTGP